MEHEDFRAVLSERVGSPMVPLSSPGPLAEGNMENISSTIPINISHNPGTIENVYIGVECSHAKIQEYTSYLRNSVISLLGITTKCHVSTLVLPSMKLRFIPTLSLFDNACMR